MARQVEFWILLTNEFSLINRKYLDKGDTSKIGRAHV